MSDKLRLPFGVHVPDIFEADEVLYRLEHLGFRTATAKRLYKSGDWDFIRVGRYNSGEPENDTFVWRADGYRGLNLREISFQEFVDATASCCQSESE